MFIENSMVEFYLKAIDGCRFDGRKMLNVLTCMASCRSLNDDEYEALIKYIK